MKFQLVEINWLGGRDDFQFKIPRIKFKQITSISSIDIVSFQSFDSPSGTNQIVRVKNTAKKVGSMNSLVLGILINAQLIMHVRYSWMLIV